MNKPFFLNTKVCICAFIWMIFMAFYDQRTWVIILCAIAALFFGVVIYKNIRQLISK